MSAPVGWLFDEGYAIGPLLITAVISIAPGQFLFHLYRKAPGMGVRHAMVTAVVSWALVPLIGVLPIMLIAAHLGDVPGTPDTVLAFGHFWNAFFEISLGGGMAIALTDSSISLSRGLSSGSSYMSTSSASSTFPTALSRLSSIAR